MMFFLFCLLVALVSAYPNREPCTGDCWTHDPALAQRQSDGKYFRFATGDGVTIATADSLRGPWTAAGSALAQGSDINLNGVNKTDIWAPDVHYENGVYYMYYVISKLGTQDSEIGVATSQTMEAGSWNDHGVVGIPANGEYNRIDPNWITIGGKPYLNFGSYWNDIFQIEMQGPLQAAAQAPRNLAFNGSLNHREEGSFMFQNGNWFYLLFSAGIANAYTATYPAPGEEYSIRMCRSESGISGFVDMQGRKCLESGGSMLLSSHGEVYAPGGQGVLEDQHLGPVLYYHYYTPEAKKAAAGNSGYRFGWNELGFRNGWPYIK
ncbi:uncharacterized protein PFLUO_LOCUS4728 [Penicillium psychrofluorescens]|uniref:uncharacterized protein n=1 Tax=Penicillium psychrofluorescens TaxID=3158075 RepID=UPI003CCD4996